MRHTHLAPAAELQRLAASDSASSDAGILLVAFARSNCAAAYELCSYAGNCPSPVSIICCHQLQVPHNRIGRAVLAA